MACAELDPQRFYIPNSPYYGIDSNDPKQWDTHGYTNIWYVPGYDHVNFASEDTRIAAPDVKSLNRFFDPAHLGLPTIRRPGNLEPFIPGLRRGTTIREQQLEEDRPGGRFL